MAIHGDWLLIGAPAVTPGAIYFFVRQQNGQWVQGQRREPTNISGVQWFGDTLAFDGDWAIIGAELSFDLDGRIYFFQNVGGSWTERQRFTGKFPGGRLGTSVALDGEWAFAGAPLEDVAGFDECGVAKVYHLSGTTWSQVDELAPAVPDDYELFGWTMQLAGDRLMIGAFDGVSTLILGSVDWYGAVHRFEWDGEAWSPHGVIIPIDRELYGTQAFGSAMAIDEDAVLIGAKHDDEAGINAGAAYFFDLTGQSGTRCVLTDAAVQFGTLMDGAVSSLKTSENFRYRIRSQFGFAASEPNLAELRIGARNNVVNPDVINLLIEARITQPGGTMKVRLRNWNTNTLTQVHQYTIGPTETVEPVSDLSAASYIRPSDNRVEVSLRSSVLATFAASGFEAQHDFINVLVRD